jgi:hypothetical protein
MDERNEDNGELPDIPSTLQDEDIPVAIGSATQYDPIHNSKGTAKQAPYKGKQKILDWTRHDIPNASHFVEFLRSFDWSSTPLGPMKQWSIALRLHVLTTVANPAPRGLIWGPEETFIYNASCEQLIGDKHPHAMGRHISTFKDFYRAASTAITRARETGEVTSMTNLPISMDRYQDTPNEETIWSYDLVPLCGERGIADGVLFTMRELTSLIVAERRMTTVLDLAKETSGYDDLKHVWEGIMKTLAKNTTTCPSQYYTPLNTPKKNRTRHTTRSRQAQRVRNLGSIARQLSATESVWWGSTRTTLVSLAGSPWKRRKGTVSQTYSVRSRKVET